ncbi:hypothetical protein Fleli_3481 [Bernardetia litoralis DSM 6794]|uniref:Uncharacterized protein n=1 Tax=Bernardetia litoralis (strain ATCC 23117 / DSM 6794 / NBRC 15988 / NCIMB 1366 / Fx l1 / Sio-4) TaxID=880071 RepID=I4APB6_BERLS|nr:hypothetical protein [Bernardetia litoralis]AFM05801.1 hypothetical protein Fleli_3481 [Bernardetia litoralis DSM 6794]
MKELLSLFDALSKSYGLFGVNKVEDINYLILGLRWSNNSSLEIAKFMHGFSRFIEKKFEINRQTDWERNIRLISFSDAHTLELFKESFFEYCKKENVL